MIRIVFTKCETDKITLGNVKYGTILRNIPGHPNSVYMKVDKRQLGERLHLDYPSKHSILLNLKTGALRAVAGSTKVELYDGVLELEYIDNKREAFNRNLLKSI